MFSAYKTTTILLDGKRVKLQLWDTSGQGRFCTIIRSYSRGAQGILLVYDITNKWSFDGIDRWLKEVEEVSNGFKILLVHPSDSSLKCNLNIKFYSMHLVYRKYWLAIVYTWLSRGK